MSESLEHSFLKQTFLKVLQDFSTLKLYSFEETEGKKFDFSCLLVRDMSRPLVGEIVWSHSKGIDKDIRLLLSDNESEIKAYVVKDTKGHRRALEKIFGDFRKLGRHKELSKLKVFWIRPDLHADDKGDQRQIAEELKSKIVQDILFQVIFGNISPQDIRFFLDVSGTIGLNFLVLYEIAINGFLNISEMSRRISGRLPISAGPIREKLIVLKGAGFLSESDPGGIYCVSPKGKAFLDITARLFQELKDGPVSGKLEYLLSKLGCKVVSESKIQTNQEEFGKNAYITLVKTVKTAIPWGINLENMKFKDNTSENRFSDPNEFDSV